MAESEQWRRAILRSVAGLIVSSIIGALFAFWVKSSGDWRTGLPWERALVLGIDRTVPVAFDWVMLGLPWLGTNLTLLPIVAGFSLWVWRTKGRADLALHLTVTAVGSLLMNAVLKDIFSRPRPELWVRRGQYQWSAYPSGHAIVCVALYFTIALMLYRELEWRWPFVVAAVLLVVILYSRLYLGVHWPTDVLGGLLVGLAWLVATQYAFTPLRRRERGVRPSGAPTALRSAWQR